MLRKYLRRWLPDHATYTHQLKLLARIKLQGLRKKCGFLFGKIEVFCRNIRTKPNKDAA